MAKLPEATTRAQRNPGGVILWQGKSRIDGAPIVAIATFGTRNEKTGDVVQTWIIRTDISPVEASQTGADESVCGACPLRGAANGKTATGRSCYVNLGQAPLAIWRAFRTGRYPVATQTMLAEGVKGRMIRLGAYGDPVAVPRRVWKSLLRHGSGHAGYTHQWRLPIASAYRDLLMASVENGRGADDALAMGWRYFRVRRATDPVLLGEIICPAAPEGQYRRTCATCKACDGRKRDGQVSVVIIGHGGIAAMSNVRKALDTAASIN